MGPHPFLIVILEPIVGALAGEGESAKLSKATEYRFVEAFIHMFEFSLLCNTIYHFNIAQQLKLPEVLRCHIFINE